MRSFYTSVARLDKTHVIILNTFTGAIDILPLNAWKEVLSSSLSHPDTAEYLKQRGHIVSGKEVQDIEKIHRLYKEERLAPHFVVLLTYECNLNCDYCFLQHLKDKSGKYAKKTMTKSMIDKMLETVRYFRKEYDSSNRETIEITGGEPLLPGNKEILLYLIDRISENGWKFSIVTNGTYLRDWAHWLREQPAFSAIKIDLDGTQPIHDTRRPKKSRKGSFSEIVEGIEKIREMKIETTVKVTVDEHNVNHLPTLANFVILNGWDRQENLSFSIGLTLSHQKNKTPTQYDTKTMRQIITLFRNNPEMRQAFKPFVPWRASLLARAIMGKTVRPIFTGCRVPCMLFDPLGDIYPCNRVVGDPSWVIGRYYPTLLMNRKNVKVLKERSIFTLEKCKGCKYSLLCGGGCTFDAKLFKGTIMTELCPPWEYIITEWMPSHYKWTHGEKIA